ncbi:MAG: hypothetical protein ACOC0B_02060 [bacterium]
MRSDPRFVVGIVNGEVRALPDWSVAVQTIGDRDAVLGILQTFYLGTAIPGRWKAGTISDDELDHVSELLRWLGRVDRAEVRYGY